VSVSSRTYVGPFMTWSGGFKSRECPQSGVAEMQFLLCGGSSETGLVFQRTARTTYVNHQLRARSARTACATYVVSQRTCVTYVHCKYVLRAWLKGTGDYLQWLFDSRKRIN
jgi:hypothetical protein